MPTPDDPQLAPARKLMCSEGGRQWVEDVVLKPFGYRMTLANECVCVASCGDRDPDGSGVCKGLRQ